MGRLEDLLDRGPKPEVEVDFLTGYETNQPLYMVRVITDLEGATEIGVPVYAENGAEAVESAIAKVLEFYRTTVKQVVSYERVV